VRVRESWSRLSRSLDGVTSPHTPPVSPTVAQSRVQTEGPRVLSRVIGIAGELLILIGALIALYVAWQLFYTDVQADREQQQVLDGLSWVQPAGTDNSDQGPVTIPAQYQFRDVAPPVTPPAEHTETFAALFVPRWGDDYARPISEGVERKAVLDKLGIGHYPQSAMPGELGNVAIAGHRTSYGKPFTDVDTLAVGDAVIVQTEGAWYVYRVTDWSIVRPTAIETIAPVPGQLDAEPNGHYITLTTCHPRYSAAQRWVVHGVLDYWAPTGHGIPPEMVEDLS